MFPLIGWLLDPVAGSVACAIGSLVGVFMAPHTAGIAVLPVVLLLYVGYGVGKFGWPGDHGLRALRIAR